jgi:tight adherence protein B
MILDLVAAALAGGAPPAGALRAVAVALQVAGDPSGPWLAALAARWEAGVVSAPGATGVRPREASDRQPPIEPRDPLDALQGSLDLAAATGLGPVALVHAAAADERRRRAAAQVAQARRLGVLVLLPTGLCLLPAFVLLTVVPLVIGLLIG